MNYEIHRFSFQSPMKSGDEINDRVQGNVYFHSSRSPVHIVVVHGWRMDQWEKINRLFLNPFDKSGFHMWQMILPFHFDRAYSTYSGEYMISANIKRSVFAVGQALLSFIYSHSLLSRSVSFCFYYSFCYGLVGRSFYLSTIEIPLRNGQALSLSSVVPADYLSSSKKICCHIPPFLPS